MTSPLFSILTPQKRFELNESLKAFKRHFLVIFMWCTSHALIAQHVDSCKIQLPESTNWTGRTTLDQLLSSSASVSLTLIASHEIFVSDITCGLFKKYDNQSEFKATLKFQCFEVLPQELETNYGDIKIIGGHWDQEANVLTIDWSNEFNDIKEKSVISVSL